MAADEAAVGMFCPIFPLLEMGKNEKNNMLVLTAYMMVLIVRAAAFTSTVPNALRARQFPLSAAVSAAHVGYGRPLVLRQKPASTTLQCSHQQHQKGESLAQRYLRESNKCRPLDPAAAPVHLYAGDTFPIANKAPVTSSAAATGRRLLCSVALCRRPIWHAVVTLMDNLIVQHRWLLAAALAVGNLLQRLIPALPWVLVRALVGVMGRLEALRSMRYFRPLVNAGEYNPHLEVQLAPLLSKEVCQLLIDSAERYASSQGWSTSRHKTHATTDIPVQCLPEGGALWNTSIAPRVQQAITSLYGFHEQAVTPVDVFVVKYQVTGQRELSVHRDGALMTFSLLLNDPADFEGGGTYFEESARVYRPAQVCLFVCVCLCASMCV